MMSSYGENSAEAAAGTVNTASQDFINPVVGIITSAFGYRINPIDGAEELHNGIDIAASVGESALAVKDGTVIEIGDNELNGIYLRYKTYDGYTVGYAHLSKAFVNEGDTIKQGDVIALTGNTGKSTGPHLHYTLWKEEQLLDPVAYVNLEKVESY